MPQQSSKILNLTNPLVISIFFEGKIAHVHHTFIFLYKNSKITPYIRANFQNTIV